MSQLFWVLLCDVHPLRTRYQVPKRGCWASPCWRCSEPPQALSGSGSADKEGRAELVGRARGEVGRAGRAEAPPKGQAGEGGRGRGAGAAVAPRVRPGRGGRACPRGPARAAAAVAARRPRSSRRPQSAPAQHSLLAPVPAGASSWTAAAAARGAGGRQRDGTPSGDEGKEGTSRGRGWQCPRAPGGEEWCALRGRESGESWRGDV